MVHETPAARQPHRPLSHLSAHLHTVSSKVGGKGFRHFDGSSVPKCSFHPCSVSSSLALGSLLLWVVACKWHAVWTIKSKKKKSLLLDVASDPTTCGRESINSSTSSGVDFYPKVIKCLSCWVDLALAKTRTMFFSANTASFSVKVSALSKFTK